MSRFRFPRINGFRDSVRHHRSWLTVALFGADTFRDDRPGDSCRSGGAAFGQPVPTRELYIAAGQDEPTAPDTTRQADRHTLTGRQD